MQPTQKQLDLIYQLGRQIYGTSSDKTVKKKIQEKYGADLDNIESAEASPIIRDLKLKAGRKRGMFSIKDRA